MLPEHVKELRLYIHEEYHDVQETTLDEQQMEEMNEMILEAMEYTLPLELTLYKNKRFHTITGYVHYIDTVK
jgi:YolD-like protein